MPTMAIQLHTKGNQRPWNRTSRGLLMYLVKSGMLTPTVDLEMWLAWSQCMRQIAFLPTSSTAVKRPHRQPCLLRARDFRALAPDIATTLSFDTDPDQHAHHRHGRHDGLGHEQPLHPVDRDEQKRKLNDPEEEVSDQSLTRHPRRLWQMIGHSAERGPDGSDDLCHGTNGEIVGDSMPEHGSDKSQDHGEFCELVAEGCASKYREWYMAFGSCIAIQRHGNGHDGRSNDDRKHCFFPLNDQLQVIRRASSGAHQVKPTARIVLPVVQL